MLASVTFTADTNGVICCAVPAGLARELYAAFTAGDPDEEPPVAALSGFVQRVALVELLPVGKQVGVLRCA